MDAVGECEQDAFWLFCAIVEGVLRDYYSLTLYGVRRDTMVLAAALRRLRPELAAHLDRCVHQALCVKIDFRPPPMFCMVESQFHIPLKRDVRRLRYRSRHVLMCVTRPASGFWMPSFP